MAGRPALHHVALGAAFEAEDALVALLAAVRRQAAIPSMRFASLASFARQRIDQLAERGAVEQTRGQHRAEELVDAVTAMAAASPVVDQVVDVQVDRILRPLVGAVLDEVLALLEAEPERIRSLIKGQREGLVDELVGRIRTGAAVSDAAVDRWTARMLRRGREPAPARPGAP
jgi:hypothetical protein